MRGYFLSLLLVVLIADSTTRWESIRFIKPEVEATIGGNEDPQARIKFEELQIVDPRTGIIPKNVRQKELRFSSRHLTRQYFESSRNSGIPSLQWDFAGPNNVGGRTRAAAIDIQDISGNTIIAGGVSGGIWKSSNGGSDWQRKSDPILRNSVTALAQDIREGKEDIWYAGTGELLGNSARASALTPYRGDGLFKSTDGGETWTQISSTGGSDPSKFESQFQYAWRIVTDHTDPINDVILVAAYGGILRSVDGGETWASVLGRDFSVFPEDFDLNEVNAPLYTDIAITPNGQFYAYMSDRSPIEQNYWGGGVYWSQDGIIWEQINLSVAAEFFDRGVLAANDSKAYFFISMGSMTSLFRYDFSGVDNEGKPIGTRTDVSGNLPDFEDIGALNIQSGYNMVVKIHPEDPNLVLLGGTNLYRSTDGFSTGENISWIGGYKEGSTGALYENHHPDQHEIIFDPSNQNNVYSFNDGGVFHSENIYDQNVAWSSLNNGYATSQFYTIHIPKSENEDVLVGGMQDNGTYVGITPNSSSDWVSVLGGDGSYNSSVPLGLFWYYSAQEGRIYRFSYTEEASTFTRIDPKPGPELTNSSYVFINPFVMDPLNYNVMYLAGGNSIWKNSNLAQIPNGSNDRTALNWELLTSSVVDSGLVSAMEITPNSESLFYGTSTGEIYRLGELNGTPQLISSHDFGDLQFISSIASSPDNDDELIVILSNYGIKSVFYSNDGGDTFSDISGNLEEFPDGTGNGPSIRWSEIVPMDDGSSSYFVGTSVGLYSTDNLNGTSTEWLKEGDEAIGKSVIRMMDYRPSDGTLVVATHGNGVYRTSVAGHKEIQPSSASKPNKFQVSKSYPNPFSDVTKIEFEIPETNYLKVDIYDMRGNHVRNLFYGPQFAGVSSVTWDGKNQHGQYVLDGMYIFRIYFDGLIQGGRIVYNR